MLTRMIFRVDERKKINNKIVNETETFWIAEAQLIYY
jgi:hypothetical protein